MKHSLAKITAFSILLAPFPRGLAANFTWDTVSGDGATITADSGIWDLSATNLMWNNGSGNVAWTAGNTAIFGGTDGTYAITVGSAALAPSGITFNNSGYTLNSSAATTIGMAGPVTLASGKSATIGANLTLNRGTTFTITGGGTLTLNGRITGNTSPSEITGGATLDVNSGGSYSMNTSLVVGAFNAGANLNGTMNVNGGAVTMTNATGNFVLGNINTTGANTTAIVNLNSGSIALNSASPFGVRFGNNAQSAGTVTGVFNLNGGTLTTTSVGRGVISGTGVINSTFNFNGGTLIANKSNATFIQNLTSANVLSGGAKIDSGVNNITIIQSLLDGGGGGGLEKLGTGVLTLSGTNTYTGTTTISSGTLSLGDGGATGSLGLGNIVNNGALIVNRNNATTLANAISGAGSLTIAGAGVTALGGSNTYTGGTSVNAGRMDLDGSMTSNISIATGAGVGGEGITTGSITFTGSTKLAFDPSTSGHLRANTVDASAATVTLQPTIPAAGTGIVVLETTGGITGPITNFVFSGRGTPYFNVDNTQLLFDYAPGTLKWKGNDPTNPTFWDTNVTANWLNGASADKFIAGDDALFDDTASSFNVAIQAGGTAPRVTTFNNNDNAYTLSGDAINGNGSLIKNGTNTLIVTNTNTYTGGTTINGGTVQLGDTISTGGSLGTGEIVNSGSLLLNFGITNGTVSNVISGTGSLMKQGSSAISLTGSSTYFGSTNITAGTLQIGNGGTTGNIGVGSIVNDATLALNRSDSALVVNNVILGIGGVTQAGSGVATLGGANLYEGITNVAAGSLTITNPTALGSTVAGTSVAAAAELRMQGGITVTGENLTLNGGGAGAGTGNLRSMSGNNVWAGPITATGAITRIDSAADLLTVSGSIAMPPVAGNLLVFQGFGNMAVSGVISGVATLISSSNGNPTSTRVVSGANTFTGPTSVNGGTLSIASLNSVNGGTPTSNLGAPVTVANGTINVAGTNVAGTLRYTGTGETTDRVINLASTTGTPTLEQAGPSGVLKFTSDFTATGIGIKTLTLAGSTSGTGEIGGKIPDSNSTNKTSVAKTGSGKWTLSGVSTYTGDTAIQAGTLALAATGSINLSPNIIISAGATFDVTAFAGTYFTGSTQTISGGTTAAPGNISGAASISTESKLSPGIGATGIGTLNFANDLTLQPGCVLNFDLGATSDLVTVSGALALNGVLNVTNASAVTGTFPIITYTGARTGSGLTIGTTPPGLYYSISTSTPGVVNLIVSATPPGFANWQSTTWPGETDLNIIGPQADPDRDGVPNLVEYALGMDGVVSSQAGLPTLSTVNVAGTDYLSLSIVRPLGSRSDLTYVAEFSDGMTNNTWVPGELFGAVTNNGNGTETVVWRDTVGVSAARRFARLRVTQI